MRYQPPTVTLKESDRIKQIVRAYLTRPDVQGLPPENLVHSVVVHIVQTKPKGVGRVDGTVVLPIIRAVVAELLPTPPPSPPPPPTPVQRAKEKIAENAKPTEVKFRDRLKNAWAALRG